MATYFVRPTNGSDAADGLSFANAFQTFQKALDTAATGGDFIRLCPEAVETTAVTVDIDTNTGTVLAPITIEPGNTTDGGRDISLTYTIQASSSMTGLLEFGNTQDYYRIFNLIMDGNANATNPLYNNADGADQNVLTDCRMTDGLGDGINIRGAGRWFFYNCEVDNNAANGHDHTSGSRGIRTVIGGSVHDNTANGIVISVANCDFINVEIYDNGQDGVTSGTAANDFMMMDGCTIFGNTGDGLQLLSGTENLTIVNTSFSGNGGFGVNFNTGSDTDTLAFYDFNHTFNNTSGASDQTLPGDNNQTGDPLFTSTTDGSEDFIPGSTSPLNRNGIMGQTIGARQAADPAGGGGGLGVAQGIQSIGSGIVA